MASNLDATADTINAELDRRDVFGQKEEAK
jgi:hypothetical protein